MNLEVLSNADEKYSSPSIKIISLLFKLTRLFIESIFHSGGSQELNGARNIIKIGSYIFVASGVSDGLEILSYQKDNTGPYILPNNGYDYS